MPVYLKLDETDKLLNPMRGYRAQLAVTPSHTERFGDNGENAARSLAFSRAWHVAGVKGRDQPLLVIETAEERP